MAETVFSTKPLSTTVLTIYPFRHTRRDSEGRALSLLPPAPASLFPNVPFSSCTRTIRKPVTIPSLLGEYLALLSQQYGIWVILLNMNGPIHGAQWSRLAMTLLPLPPPYSKQYSAMALLALFPEINKRGTRSRPWNPQSIKPPREASSWREQSDLATMGKSYSALWDLADTIALPSPKHTLVSMSSGPPWGILSSLDDCVAKRINICYWVRRWSAANVSLLRSVNTHTHTADYRDAEYINGITSRVHAVCVARTKGQFASLTRLYQFLKIFQKRKEFLQKLAAAMEGKHACYKCAALAVMLTSES